MFEDFRERERERERERVRYAYMQMLLGAKPSTWYKSAKATIRFRFLETALALLSCSSSIR